MWAASLITAGASAFGLLFSACILPSALLVTIMWLVIRADAFDPNTSGLGFGNLLVVDFNITAGGVLLLFILLIVAVAALVQGFHFAIVRVLEGYWGGSGFAAALTAAGVDRHRDRLLKAKAVLHGSLGAVKKGVGDASPTDRRLQDQVTELRSKARRGLQVKRAKHIVASYPPSENDLLPTRFGNIMRAGERRAGERYGWRTIPTWPRLYQGLSDSTATAYRMTYDGVVTAAVFCVTFLAITLFTVAAFYDDPELWWFCGAAALFTFTSYRAAVASAVTLGVIQAVAFDRHRFDLFESMHLPLPNTPAEEQMLAGKLSRFFSESEDGLPVNARRSLLQSVSRYSHAEPWKGKDTDQ
jgi:hypothetical protein